MGSQSFLPFPFLRFSVTEGRWVVSSNYIIDHYHHDILSTTALLRGCSIPGLVRGRAVVPATWGLSDTGLRLSS